MERSIKMDKREFEGNLRMQLDKWDAQINRLRAKADVASAETRARYHEEIEQLREQQRRAERRLDDFNHASDSAWEEMKIGMENAWRDLGDAVDRATTHFK